MVTQVAQGQTFTILHNFDNGPDGAEPNAGLTMDGAGNLYGVTLFSSAFQRKRTASGWRFTQLHIFGCCKDGFEPSSRLTIGPDGSLYGTTFYGGGYENCDNGRKHKLAQVSGFRDQGTEIRNRKFTLDINRKSTTIRLWIHWVQHLRLCLIQPGERCSNGFHMGLRLCMD